MTETEFLRLMLRNCDVAVAIERENIAKSEARIEAAEGYKQAFSNRLEVVSKTKGDA